MLRLDEGAEDEAITPYKQTIKAATDEGDTTTRRLRRFLLKKRST